MSEQTMQITSNNNNNNNSYSSIIIYIIYIPIYNLLLRMQIEQLSRDLKHAPTRN